MDTMDPGRIIWELGIGSQQEPVNAFIQTRDQG